VHKFQGSQAKHVFVVLERPGMVSDEHYARWLYTAVSRASDYLYLVMP
jgi:ATP-dependent exoDNAse (exonuclease V) alpha subunit